MAASAEQIKRELKALEKSTAAIAEEMHQLYSKYLNTLGQATKQQLILACYHLCTQTYPSRFLRLSYQQRQQLQQALQSLGLQAQQQLSDQVNILQRIFGLAAEEEDEMETETSAILDLADLQSQPPAVANQTEHSNQTEQDNQPEIPLSTNLTEPSEPSELSEPSESLEPPEPSEPSESVPAANPSQSPDDQASDLPPGSNQADVAPILEQLEQLNQTSESESSTPSTTSNTPSEALAEPPVPPSPKSSALSVKLAIAVPTDPLNPLQLIVILKQLEHFVTEILQGASQASNRLLQQADVLPKQLPEPVFAAAAKAGEAAEAPPAGHPNLLKLLVEVAEKPTEDEEEEDDNRLPVTPLVAVHLRLSDLEFANPTLSAWRSKLRSTLKQLEGLARKYQKKQQQLAIAEAESAWRSSWYDE
jgi:hypothetical protein